MKTENKSAVTEALEMIELNLKQFPNAFLALNGTWGECIKALEKQIPKKPKIRWSDEWGCCEYFCPVCNAEFDMSLYREYRQFCSKCGQKIDWSEENE